MSNPWYFQNFAIEPGSSDIFILFRTSGSLNCKRFSIWKIYFNLFKERARNSVKWKPGNERIKSHSYTNKLFKKGINKIAQKVGEEAVELVIEAKDDNIGLFKNEAADLLFHLLILLKAKGVRLQNIEEVLQQRHRQK